jgi:SAM-dependent methyltransferase
MIEKARANAEKLGYHNVEFRQGDIEKMPLSSGIADVIVSNCVLNLVPNKAAVFAEMFRVLKPGGHFSISDVVLQGALPDAFRQVAEFYAGCISGAIQKDAYLKLIENAGFKKITVQKEKVITVPDDILAQHFAPEAIDAIKQHNNGIYSITVFAQKPEGACCAPGCCN